MAVGVLAAACGGAREEIDAPRYTPDRGRFAVTTTSETEGSGMGDMMRTTSTTYMEVSFSVTAVGTDTLRVVGVIDSISYSMDGPPMELGTKALSNEMLQALKGDTAVVLIDPLGRLVDPSSRGDASSFLPHSSFELPSGLTAGETWIPQVLSVGTDPVAAATGAMLSAMQGELGTGMTGRFDGEETRDGVTLWKFTVLHDIDPTSLSDVQTMDSTLSVKRNRIIGSSVYYIDKTGRFISAESETIMSQEMQLMSMSVRSANRVRSRIERIGR